MQALLILLGALFTVSVAAALGASLLRKSCDDLALRFVTGAAVLSAAVFCICAVQLAYPATFAVLGIAALWPWRKRLAQNWRPNLPDWTSRVLCLALGLYFILYFFNYLQESLGFQAVTGRHEVIAADEKQQ